MGTLSFGSGQTIQISLCYFHLSITSADYISRVWLLHCHIEWHMVTGLIATVITAPEYLHGMRIPPDHLALCESQSEGSSDGRWPYQIPGIS